jgi:hypothetical protein
MCRFRILRCVACGGLLAAWVWAAGAERLMAQAAGSAAGQGAKPASKPATSPAGGAQPQAAPATARRKILASREWRETVHAFNEWLSAQKIYSRSEVSKIRSELNHKVAKMSAGQLREFLKDTEEKMKVLTSKEAEEARTWLAQRMAVEVRASSTELQESKPDVVHMTSAQLEENLKQIEAQRAGVRQTQRGFDSGRQAQIKDVRNELKEEEQQREQSLDRSATWASSPYGNYYQPYMSPGPGGFSGTEPFGGGAPEVWFGYPY